VFVLGLAVAIDGQLFNTAAVVHGGRILGFVPKEKLPTYNVFYEGRTFSKGTPGLRSMRRACRWATTCFGFDFGTLSVEVCEDFWSPEGRCGAAATRRGTGRQSLLLAIPRRHRRHPARGAGDAVPATTR